MSFASADAGVGFAGGIVVLTSGLNAGARSTPERRKVVEIRQTPIAFRTAYARLTSVAQMGGIFDL